MGRIIQQLKQALADVIAFADVDPPRRAVDPDKPEAFGAS
jgi:hypothetical protein